MTRADITAGQITLRLTTHKWAIWAEVHTWQMSHGWIAEGLRTRHIPRLRLRPNTVLDDALRLSTASTSADPLKDHRLPRDHLYEMTL